MVYHQPQLADNGFIGPRGMIFLVGAGEAITAVILSPIHIKGKQVIVVPFKRVLDETLQVTQGLLRPDGDDAVDAPVVQ